MFRKFLSDSNAEKSIAFNWIKKINGLIRVAIFDEDFTRAYVVVFIEQENQYSLFAFDVATGENYWTANVGNGGYGAPASINDIIVFPTKFRNIIALSKEDGKKRWEFETEYRVRSPLNVVEKKIYFSSGCNIMELNPNGDLTNKWEFPGAFFYGSVDVFNEVIVSLGTLENEEGESIVKVFAFHRNGELVYELPLFKGPIISSDTSGIAWKGSIGFVGGDNIIVSFDSKNGNIIWTSHVIGFAGRQVCSVDNDHVYYCTQAGIIGALSISNGESTWQIKAKDRALVSPISILGKRIIVLADGYLNIFKCSCGKLIQKIPVGHSPYSMVSLKQGFALLGGGEPPHNGLLFCFKFSDLASYQNYTCVTHCSNSFIEEKHTDILINIHNICINIKYIQLDVGLFHYKEPVIGERFNEFSYAFRLLIPLTICPGDYTTLLYIYLDNGECITRPICFSLQRKVALPSRAYLSDIPDIIQEKPRFSGAAIGSIVKGLYGDYNVQQSQIRGLVDASRELANYEPHETWRLILRRVLSSGAREKLDLPEFQKLAITNGENIPNCDCELL